MSLTVIVGFDGPGASAKPFPVYVGRSGSEGKAAMDSNSTAARFEVFSNAVGFRKSNPRFRSVGVPVVQSVPALSAEEVEKARAERKAAKKAAKLAAKEAKRAAE